MRFVSWAVVVWIAGVGLCAAQVQVHPGVRMQGVSQSFFEFQGVSWFVQGPQFWARFGAVPAVPPWGGVVPQAGVQTGWGGTTGPWSWGVNLWAAQGSRTSFVTASPSLVLLPGQGATLFHGTWHPFVVSVIPVVGSWQAPRSTTGLQMALGQLSQGGAVPGDTFCATKQAPLPHRPPKPVQAKTPRSLHASPGSNCTVSKESAWANDHPGGSLAQWRRRHEVWQRLEQRRQLRRARELFRMAQRFHQEGKLRLARRYYQAALPLASGELQAQVAQKLRQLEGRLVPTREPDGSAGR